MRPRRLTDVSKIDTSADILGISYDSPIVIAPTGSNRAFHPDAEVAVAKAARTGNHLQILSTVATTSIEDAIAARGAPVWFQLYTTQRWEIGEALARRAERAGAPVIVVTLDVRSSAKWETFTRLRRTDTRDCGSCHGGNDYLSRKPNFAGIALGGVGGTAVTNITWESIKRLRDTVKTKIVLKGILTHEDTRLATEAGIDAIIVSNHGGRVGTASAPPSTCCRISLRPPAACRFWSTAVFDAAATSSGAGDRRQGGMHRPASSVGTGRLRPARRRARAHHPARRDARDDGAGRCAIAQGSDACDGEAGLVSRVAFRASSPQPAATR
ncbi:alpha-hydroxy acid oxidase [Bradyrhizobium sp.]|uniref:alpha-hydroxy acid oxidase n=1 Tax=Bradyrhizobium sp. TaxID=376 RepID=UPI002DF8258F|nr:alpha-hydroxy acid oxidase [Bradyrhizobium sp.]